MSPRQRPAPKRFAPETPAAPPAPKRPKHGTTVPDSSDSETKPPTLRSNDDTYVGSDDSDNEVQDNEDQDDEAFSHGFFRALTPAIDAHYNRESNLIHLRCAENEREKATVEAKIRLFDSMKERTLALRDSEAQLTGAERLRFHQVRAGEAAAAVMKIQKERELIEENKAGYQFEIQAMIRELEDRKAEVAAKEDEVEDEETLETLETLAAIRKGMMNLRA